MVRQCTSIRTGRTLSYEVLGDINQDQTEYSNNHDGIIDPTDNKLAKKSISSRQERAAPHQQGQPGVQCVSAPASVSQCAQAQGKK